MKQTLAIACDHGALDLKRALINHLNTKHPDLNILDLGTHTSDSVDYPEFADRVAHAILEGKAHLGLLCCGTGIGISMRANRYKGIRAALVYDTFTATMAKAHNNANILCLGGRTTPAPLACTLVDTWLTTAFEGGRHQNRLDKLDL